MRKLVFLSIALSFISSDALAWRETGHFTVCEIAFRYTTAQARAEMKKLLDGNRFATECTWPDKVRRYAKYKKTYPWHFVNLNDDMDYYENINPKGDAIQALIINEDILRSKSTSKKAKLEALRFLGHMTGDIHQPLHVGRSSDLGGNRIRVSWFGSSDYEYTDILIDSTVSKVKKINLHKVIDLHMLEKFIEENGLEDQNNEYAYSAYADLINRPNKEDVDTWQKDVYTDWMNESLELREDIYKVGNKKLAKTYYKKHIKTLNKRMLQAGVRLGGLLNRIFDPSYKLSTKEKNMRKKIKKALEAQEQ